MAISGGKNNFLSNLFLIGRVFSSKFRRKKYGLNLLELDIKKFFS